MTPALARLTRPLADTRGMTLAEILVALVIISIGLVGLASVVPLSSWGIQEGNQMTTSVFLAEQRLEQLKGMRWSAADATTGLVANDCIGSSGTTSSSWSFSGGTAATSATCSTANPPTTAYTTVTYSDETPSANTLAAPYTNYTRQVRIKPCDAAGANCGVSSSALRYVAVRVTYTPLQGLVGVATAQKYVELSMLVAQR
jgi:prepilin-type N-terminal cleavage/methylation domain-containing protein